ncbi:hypothetical protein HanPSC8_Chr16g0743461 [Helianthus annuus]|nr:hypothetical protein HanPSC8_Chr16g0743461 [Helianthus annuus]
MYSLTFVITKNIQYNIPSRIRFVYFLYFLFKPVQNHKHGYEDDDDDGFR